jgi:hypothetical protein
MSPQGRPKGELAPKRGARRDSPVNIETKYAAQFAQDSSHSA